MPPPPPTAVARSTATDRDAIASCRARDAAAKPLHSTAADKIGMFRERLILCHQRLMRHKAFAPQQVGGRKRDSIKVRPRPVSRMPLALPLLLSVAHRWRLEPCS